MKTTTPRKVISDEMRTDILSSKLSVKQLAEKHNVQVDCIYKVLRNRNSKK